MQEVIDYILEFLLRDKSLLPYVGYTSDSRDWERYKVVIVPSGFFASAQYGTPASMPQEPIAYINDIPVLYGDNRVENQGDATVIHADLVASAFFMLSRYEEYVFPDTHRDIHGRFIGKESILGRNNLLHRPNVDEYGAYLRQLLAEKGVEASPLPQILNAIYLTHDVDTITHYRSLRGILGGIKRSLTGGNDKISNILASQTDILQDPAYTFPWLLETDKRCANARQIYFIKAASSGAGCDYPKYDLNGQDFKSLIGLIKDMSPKAEFGLHCSYLSGEKTWLISDEEKRLSTAVNGANVIFSRYHYLRSLRPNDMETLIQAGIADDYTMGYADISGFRLGTSRAVRFINPKTRKLTALTLHPLTIMDCTLNEPKYMSLSYEQAFDYSKRLISETANHNGDLCLLWHNTSVSDLSGSYHKQLYAQIIDYLCRQSKR